MFKATVAFISGGLLGKLLGVFRELLLAALFGTTVITGAYRLSQTALLIPIQFLIADTLNAGFIPLFNRYAKNATDQSQKLFWILLVILCAFSLLITAGLFLGASVWVRVLAPGFDTGARNITVLFLQVLAIGAPFFIIGALFSYREMVAGGYKLTSLRASMQSVGLIVGTLLAFWTKRPVFLAWGFTGAYIVYAFWGWILLSKKGLLSIPPGGIFHEVRPLLSDFWEIMKPLLILPLILQGSIAIERVVASLMGVGVVASLDYAKFITETGMVLLAAPLGLAGLSAWSAVSHEDLKDKLYKIVPVILVVTAPISAFLLSHSRLIVQVLYARGAFDAESVALTARILFGLAFGFWAMVAGYVLIKALNAQFRNREVVIYMTVALGLNTVINVVFYRILGPFVLGLGASAYGIALFVLTIRALGITKAILPVMMWLGIGTGLYSLLAIWSVGDGWKGLSVSLVIFSAFWVLFIMTVPILKASVSPLLNRITGRPSQ